MTQPRSHADMAGQTQPQAHLDSKIYTAERGATQRRQKGGNQAEHANHGKQTQPGPVLATPVWASYTATQFILTTPGFTATSQGRKLRHREVDSPALGHRPHPQRSLVPDWAMITTVHSLPNKPQTRICWALQLPKSWERHLAPALNTGWRARHWRLM